MIQKNVFVLNYTYYANNFKVYANNWVNKKSEENFFIYQSKLEDFKDYFNKQHSNKITKDCNVYPTTLSTLEKNKIEMFNDNGDHQVSITYTPRKTDYYLLNYQQIASNILDSNSYEEYYIFDNFDSFPLKSYYQNGTYNGYPFEKLKNLKDTKIIISANIFKEDHIPISIKKLLTPYTPERILVCNSSKMNKTIEDKIKKWIFLFNEERPNLIFDETFNSQIFEDSVIDEDIYDSLDEILSSEDKENCKLAIETMANWNLEKSKIYILFLLNKHNRIQKISTSGTKNHLMILKTFPYKKYSWDGKFVPFFNKVLEMFPEEKEVIKLLVIKRMNEHLFKSMPIKNIEFKD